MKDLTRIQDQLKTLKRLGLTQQDIADLTGVSRQSIIRYKKGDEPISRTLIELALEQLIHRQLCDCRRDQGIHLHQKD